ncbi:relaxase/mobilization nuclease domain-containing protein [Ruminococcus sp. YRD2003]|uniref:relaxase/mobilization nuclease domain-containing protein n=1 Tax=Ruminococcus sp. YRD2003 TaxID=1452313 RepID=UPI0039B6F8E2
MCNNVFAAFEAAISLYSYCFKTTHRQKVQCVLLWYGRECARYFFNRFQLLYCTHQKDTNCGSMHTHIIINAVSYLNGQMIVTGYEEMNAFCQHVAQVTGQKCWFYFDNKAVYNG